MPKHPSVHHVSFNALAEQYGAQFFKAALARYALLISNPDLTHAQLEHLSVYDKIGYNDVDSNGVVDCSVTINAVYAKPGKTDQRSKHVPSRFETVLVNGRNGALSGVTGHCIARVRVVLSLHERARQSLFPPAKVAGVPIHLAYVEWFDPFTTAEDPHRMYMYWIRTAALLVAPIAPHLTEHIWAGILKEAKSVQLARWPEPSKPVDKTIVETGAYMRTTVKTIRDAETSLLKKIQKGNNGQGAAKTRSKFPEWQDACMQAVKDAYDEKANKVDDAKVREILAQKGLIKDKRAMPFIQLLKKRMAEFGAQTAFRRGLPFPESEMLTHFLPYLKKSLNLVVTDVMFVDEALEREGPGYSKAIIETS
ncbi:hypothetical protein CONPUDRAFT_159638 [Coniophora puteana RWD-64-598 SS2]|uniref:Uncharacterized protein n=1 Tax=Coniophora puteana (strain RWD-64-598) TaxID=741705 RepID=A0A5M3M7H3_CONPW|nr:uncharacterized protein CONPUDRAFT_159638 [Coniophora puteana RWD-64-598 SS2]EIW74866.1 hypothetical protein CONPUDRAFT_159638 [Coniophora puteana RWD-64-598 SS2]